MRSIASTTGALPGLALALLAADLALAQEPKGSESSGAQANPEGTEQGGSIFEQLARDPYLRRYARAPGEGWIPLLKTDTDIKFSGFVQLNVIHDFENTGLPYAWFTPSLIPVPTDDTPNTEFDARPSRLVFETRTNTEQVGGYVSTFISMDFYGTGTAVPQPRLRQGYVSWIGPESKIGFAVGQTWTTFMDLGVWPEIADLQGPNSMTGLRQGVLRGSYSVGEKQNLVVELAVEQPDTAVQNGKGITDWPDLVARANWQRDWGHLQGMLLARQLVAESTAGTGRDSSFGYGVSISGNWQVPGTVRDAAGGTDPAQRQDSIDFQIQTGSGSGRYTFDLSSAPNPQDAVYDVATQTIEPLDQFGAFVAYRHWWTERLCSVFVYGLEEVDDLGIQSDDVFKKSTYALVNLIYRSFPRMNVGIEYIRGTRRDKDGQTGEAGRIDFALNYGF